MKLALFNGSPRGKKSNTSLLLEQLIAGARDAGQHDLSVTLLMRERDPEVLRQCFLEVDVALVAFPLYTDAMPGIVKEFIEALAPLRGRDDLPRMAFLVQSGFPEAVQSRAVEAYLGKLTRRLGCEHAGTVVRGGVEGIQIMPPLMTRKLYHLTVEVGQALGREGRIPAELASRYAGKERMNAFGRTVFSVMSALGVAHFYWNGMLKENNAYGRRFDRPYVP